MGGEQTGFLFKPERCKNLLNLGKESFPFATIGNRTPDGVRSFRVIHRHGADSYGKLPERDAPERVTHAGQIFFCNLSQELEGNVDKGWFNKGQAR